MSWNASRWRRRRVARLGAGDVEADDAVVAIAHGQLGDLERAGGLAHGRDEGADRDGPALAAAAAEALEHRPPTDLVEREAACSRCSSGAKRTSA